MELKQLIELREKLYESMIIEGDISIITHLRNQDEALKQYEEAGRKYFNNHILTFHEINALLKKEETQLKEQKDYLRNFRKLVELRETILDIEWCGFHLTEEYYQERIELAKKELLKEGRNYYNNDNLIIEDIMVQIVEDLSHLGDLSLMPFNQLIEVRNATLFENTTNTIDELYEINRMGLYLSFGRAYYKMPNLTYEELEELFFQEYQQKYGSSKKLTGN